MTQKTRQGRDITLQIRVVAIFVLLLSRVFYLQMVDPKYDALSARNMLRRERVFAPRGEVVDRNGEYLVQSRGCYDFMVTYRDLSEAGFDTMRVCDVLGITRERMERALRDARVRPRIPTLVVNYVSMRDKLRFDELGVAGFSAVYRTVREYPRQVGGNLLGHIGEINEAQLSRNPDYDRGDYIGIGGIESAYESDLRGEKGYRILEVDAIGKVQSAHMDGYFDSLPVAGSRLTSTIDVRLQLLGEELLRGKVGSIVAIEPSTGEILVMVSSPSFDPEALVGRERGSNYMQLLNDPRRPLYNRAVVSRYPPGSIFKMLQALIALQRGTLIPSQRYMCYEGFRYGSRVLKCHKHTPSTSLQYAIATSCNSYFCHVFNNLLLGRREEGERSFAASYDMWRDDVLSFGFGRQLESDFLSEGAGYVPKSEYYERIYRGSWSPLTIISLSIGQGELGCTPLQMANFAATIANRGYYYIPHIIRSVEGRDSLDGRFYERQYSAVDAHHFEPIIQGLWEGVNNKDPKGDLLWSELRGWDMCGKTGTSQNPHGEDHSTFLAFAPRDNPRIAISVYVENGGWGARVAQPIASLVQEMYLTDTISRRWLIDYVKGINIDYKQY